jgi:hypothetical protein
VRTRALVMTLAVFQVASPSVLRVGPVANQLTADDLRSLRELSIRWGGQPWMLLTGTGMVPARDGSLSWSATVRLRPFSETELVRRGDQFTASTTRRGDAPRTWVTAAGGAWFWAQVKLRGREFDDVRGESDINAPFATDGIVTDDELVSVITFLRTDPIFKPERERPVASIMRVYSGDDSWISLGLWTSTSCGEGYELRPAASGWTPTWRGGVCA